MGGENIYEMANEACNRLLVEVSARAEETVRSCGEKQVHDLRVAIRRFGQALRAFEACFLPRSHKRLRKRLKKTMHFAGEVRNLDVAMQYTKEWKLTGQEGLAGQRHDAGRELTHSLSRWVNNGWSAFRLEQRRVPTSDPRARSVQDHARELLSAMATEFFNRGNDATAANATPSQMHGFRIASKKFRYTMELFAPAYGPALDARIAQVRQLQTVLGEVNDCATLRAILSGEAAASRLLKRQNQKIAEFRKQWKSQFTSAAVVRQWVGDLALLSLRKGPQSDSHHAPATMGFRSIGT